MAARGTRQGFGIGFELSFCLVTMLTRCCVDTMGRSSSAPPENDTTVSSSRTSPNYVSFPSPSFAPNASRWCVFIEAASISLIFLIHPSPQTPHARVPALRCRPLQQRTRTEHLPLPRALSRSQFYGASRCGARGWGGGVAVLVNSTSFMVGARFLALGPGLEQMKTVGVVLCGVGVALGL